MSKDEIKELESKIGELERELDLWKKYRELKDKIDELKKEPIQVIPYIPYYPTYPQPIRPWQPWEITWISSNGTSATDRFYV